jgi:hypothetical protein
VIQSSFEGASYLIVSADSEWDILEQHQLNNESAAETSITVPVLNSGDLQDGTFSKDSMVQYYKFEVGPDGNFVLHFTGDVGVYLRFGEFPTMSDYDYFINYTSGHSITVPGAYQGTWYVMILNNSNSINTAYSIKADIAPLIISDISPDKILNSNSSVINISGAGFNQNTMVALVNSAGTEFQADEVEIDSYSSLSAGFNAGTLLPGLYSVRLSDGTSTVQLDNAVTVLNEGKAEFSLNISAPKYVGYHQMATVYVEYQNTGEIPMQAPLVLVYAEQNGEHRGIMTLDAAKISNGFWTESMPEGFHNYTAFLASGKKAGVLMPGESVRKSVYYAGWVKPWDFSYPPIVFNAGYITADSSEELDESLLDSFMQPTLFSNDVWNELKTVFYPSLGTTWGSFVNNIDNQAVQLSKINDNELDITKLLNAMLINRTVLNPLSLNLKSTDLKLYLNHLELSVERESSKDIERRYHSGAFGVGWTWNWEGTVKTVMENESEKYKLVTIEGCIHRFQPDARGGYIPVLGEKYKLTEDGSGLNLISPSGMKYHFSSEGLLDSMTDLNGNKVTAVYSDGKITALNHSSGAGITLSYSGDRISTITDSAGHTVSYTYSADSMFLTKVIRDDGSVIEYSYETDSGKASKYAVTSVTLFRFKSVIESSWPSDEK